MRFIRAEALRRSRTWRGEREGRPPSSAFARRLDVLGRSGSGSRVRLFRIWLAPRRVEGDKAEFASLMDRIPLLPLPLLAEAPSRYQSLWIVLALALVVALVIWAILWITAREQGTAAEEQAVDPGEPGEESSDEGPSEDASPGGFQAATEAEAADLFSGELESGEVRQDPVYGIVYVDPPGEVDDLKRIKGVAKVLEGKLHGIGVYRFKQVAVWTDAACEEFSKLLTFKDRIYRDSWIAQARQLHEEKHGEKLPAGDATGSPSSMEN